MAKQKTLNRAVFIETMDCMPVSKLPEGPEWTYEIKLDGYRLEAVKNNGETILYSRRRNILNEKFQYIADALQKLPDETVLDGELVAIDSAGRTDFNLLQNFRSAASKIHYFAFDVLLHKGKLLTNNPLAERRAILAKILPQNDHISVAAVDHSVMHLLRFVEKHGLEGVVAKRSDSVYEPGKRSALWSKYRVNAGQEFIVGGYTPGSSGFDALIVGVYKGKDLMFAGRVRAGFVPATRREVFAKIKGLKISKCPFANLPELSEGRWGQGLTKEKMDGCVWLRPFAVVRIDFAEWTGGDKLRHTKFVAMRDDKDPRKVVRET
ncbi:MAG TPA: non-homologous end-joining DNA ligase [Terriglobales bacterium]|nr:non-homologous end-joining DNA ligase [Terriglobales bacterium]